jgi:inner membrane protein
MPSPLGHTLVGLCGSLLVQGAVPARRQVMLVAGAVFISLLPDLDVLPGLVLGDPRLYHHQATHSLFSGILFGLFFAGVARWRGDRGAMWGLWAGGLYLSHVLLDLLVDDPSPPFGVQLLWPFTSAYFIAPITPLPQFDYFDPAVGIIGTVLTLDNLKSALQEILLLAPLAALAWYLGRSSSPAFERERS